jgi:hypothetical protein
MAADAHLPLIIFKKGLEVNILSESGRPYQFGNRSILTNILIPHKGYKNDIPIYWEIRQSSISEAAYQIIRLVLEFFPISPEEGSLSFPGSSRAAFKSKYPQYRIVQL